MVAASLKHSGLWPTFLNLLQTRRTHPGDLALRGYTELVRNLIVGELLSAGKGLAAIPKLTSQFTENYAGFKLTEQEGYLISLVEGSLSIEKLLRLSPTDHFTTLFNLARLAHLKAIVFSP